MATKGTAEMVLPCVLTLCFIWSEMAKYEEHRRATLNNVIFVFRTGENKPLNARLGTKQPGTNIMG